MNRMIALALLVAGCGRPLKKVSSHAFQVVTHRGAVVERPQTDTMQTLDLQDHYVGIYQVTNYASYPEIAHRITFDTESTPEVIGILEDHCLKQIDIFEDLFSSITSSELSFRFEKKVQTNTVLVSFARKIEGSLLLGASFDCYYSTKGKPKLMELVNNTFSHLPILGGEKLSKRDLTFTFDGSESIREIENSFLVLDDEIHKTTKARLSIDSRDYVVHLSNESGELLQGKTVDLSYKQNLVGEVFYRSYLEDNLFQQNLPLTRIISTEGVTESSADGVVEAGTDVQGIVLESKRVVVFSGIETVPVLIDRVQTGATVARVEASGAQAVSLNSYASIHRINKYVRQYLSPSEVPFLDKQIQVRVNQDGQCNAYYTTEKAIISLFKAGGGCANVGEVNDVIYHEWGHALDDHTGRQIGVTDGAFSEGIGDVVSAYFNQDPSIGVGFVQGESYGIRRIDQVKIYPYDTGEVHREGGIIAGAFWSLLIKLQERYGKEKGRQKAENLFFRHLLTTDTYLESYHAVLRIDDEDGNPATKSPNHCLINDVFSTFGLTEKESCSDASPKKLVSDETLNIALYDLGGGEVGLVGSGENVEILALCFGDQWECVSHDRVHLKMPFINKNEGRAFFALQGRLPLSGVDKITLISKDGEGEIVSSRLMKVFTK